MNTNSLHESVLLQEAVDALSIKPDHYIIDGTFGRGGHSKLILDSLGESGTLLAFDKDTQAIEFGQTKFKGESRIRFIHDSFAELAARVKALGLDGKVNGVLLDLGVSSPQLDQAERGFSFMKDGPLDMRMDQSKGISAAQWIAKAELRDLIWVLKVYGEEKFATRIAHKIIEYRQEQPIVSTRQLAKIIDEATPKKDPGKHPATRSFQAIRIYINQELDDLEKGLKAAYDCLAPGGKLVVISFHSLEDRIVKRFFKKLSKGDDFPKDLPVLAEQIKPSLKLIGKPVKPSKSEVGENVRSRSAVMRVAEKV